MRELVIGSRGSDLALRQTRYVANRITAADKSLSCRIEIIKTTGDRIQDSPLPKIGDKGIFVKEIESALIDGNIDLAVHSAKDLPSEMDERLIIAAFTEREDPRDALVSKVGDFDALPNGAKVGTGSARRRAQILHARPDLKIADLRGNLDTRLRKLCSSEYDAIVLACAGLCRMNLESRITQVLPMEISLPAAGQGALAVQCCADDSAVIDIISMLDHKPTRRCISAERALLAALNAGCTTPVGANACEADGIMTLNAMVAAVDGSKIIRCSLSGEPDDWEDIGKRLAGQLIEAGADKILEDARRSAPGYMGAAG
jgi:hydroxymethylbilane synthase